MRDSSAPGRPPIFPLVMVIVIAVIGAWFAGLGAYLAALGGSIYYLLAGLGLLAAAVLLYRRNAMALAVFAVVLGATLLWALWEVGLDFWQLVPRGDLLVPIAAILLLPWLTMWLRPATSAVRGPGIALSIALLASLLVLVAALLQNPHDRQGALRQANGGAPPASYAALGDWPAYGGTWEGLKYSPLAQITPANADQLEVAWHIHTGDTKRPDDPGEFTYEVTPIKIGKLLYLCTPHNIVIALDPVTGHEVWRFDPKVQVAGTQHMSCRGVSYYDSAAKPGTAPQPPRAADCSTRIFVATNDARLIALDASSGRRCGDFGNKGEIGLAPQYPGYEEGWYQFTSAPLVTHGLVVLAGSIFDNRSVKMPSGVVRAFDAKTGRLVWNFDPGNPDETAPIPTGQHYSLSSPNSWSTSAADEKLGLIYIPFGMGAVDQYGGTRPPTTEKFASSIVALDSETGRLRWVFQTVHHDLWDMDVPAQPALVDLPIPGKGLVPALVQSTKTGNIFILDRRTGQPVIPVEERPVPQGAAPGDRVAPTQPYSLASFMPTGLVREEDMWGATALDQLTCRVAFRKLRYEGAYTPPSLQGTLVFPGNFGVMDWGGMAIDPVRKIAFAHPNYMAFIARLTTNKPEWSPRATNRGVNPNEGAPFAVYLNPFLSKLGLPCQAPPWGYVAGMDLTTGKVIWRHRNGTIIDQSPVPLPFKLGVPSLGGPITTAGGVAFMSSALDNYVRAYDVTTGRQLWEARLPAGGQATPMSYQGADGRQYVVVVAGGHGTLGTTPGDDIIAYALPKAA
ncbi:MAG TPA: membrane-bound PQQ-dependent dehydrogenase, glucose/quinate/shikimate family [Sphingomicrobium sp.]|nr:membrane-bound PQQ-dependent dehydrogenase, glucose/quinate/shikimate family [Sphingomicrobium sp.]